MIDKKNIDRILVVQFYQIGDVLLSTPLIRSLRKNFPNAQIDFCVDKFPGKIIANNPYINNIFINPARSEGLLKRLAFYSSLRKNRYNLVIDLLGTNGTAALTILSGAKYRIGWNLRIRKLAYNFIAPRIGDCYSALAKLSLLNFLDINESDCKPEIFPDSEDKSKIDSFFIENKINSSDFIVTISPYSRREARRWIPEYYAELADLLVDKFNAKIIFQYGPGELEYINSITSKMKYEPLLDPNTNLMELAILLRRSNLFIGNDNGPKHMAVAMGTPTITIYGPTDPINWEMPNTDKHLYIQSHSVDCIKCGKRICPFEDDNKMKCMKTIEPKKVLNLITNKNFSK